MRDLSNDLIGAGSGMYNTSRQVSAAVGAAALGAVMQAGIATTDFATAMGNTFIHPVVVLIVGLAAVANYRSNTKSAHMSA